MIGERRIHCTWCGAVVTGGRRFCASCGQPVVGPEGEDDDDDYERVISYRPTSISRTADSHRSSAGARADEGHEQSSSLGDKVAGVLGAVIGFPIMVILGIIGTVLPILVVVALVAGPVDTWNMMRAWIPGTGDSNQTAGCVGFDDWRRASDERANRLTGVIEPMQSGEVTDPASLRAIGDDIEAIVAEQRQSNPPTEAEKLNGMLVELYGYLGKATKDAANGDRSNFQMYDTAYRVRAAEADAENTRVFEACR